MYGPWWPVAAYNSTLQQHNLICCLQWRIQVDNDSSWWREEPGGGREKLGLCNDLDHRRQQQLRRRRPSARIEKNGSIAIDPFLAIINKLQLSPQSFGLLLASGYGRWAYVATNWQSTTTITHITTIWIHIMMHHQLINDHIEVTIWN